MDKKCSVLLLALAGMQFIISFFLKCDRHQSFEHLNVVSYLLDTAQIFYRPTIFHDCSDTNFKSLIVWVSRYQTPKWTHYKPLLCLKITLLLFVEKWRKKLNGLRNDLFLNIVYIKTYNYNYINRPRDFSLMLRIDIIQLVKSVNIKVHHIQRLVCAETKVLKSIRNQTAPRVLLRIRKYSV